MDVDSTELDSLPQVYYRIGEHAYRCRRCDALNFEHSRATESYHNW